MGITVLVLVDYYLPGYKGGGPLRTITNMVEELGRDIAFRIVTRDHDADDTITYPGVQAGRWYDVGRGKVLYVTREQRTRGLRRVLLGIPHDVLYVNSVFSRLAMRTALLSRLGTRLGQFVVAPRGELHPGALSTGSWGSAAPRFIANRIPAPKSMKKHAYLAAARRMDLYRSAVWHASNEAERADIVREFGRAADVVIAPNLAAAASIQSSEALIAKRPGQLRAVFVSRIESKKNLAEAIRMLDGIRGEILLDIIGPIQDQRYWATCQEAIGRLPANVNACYRGPVVHDDIGAVLRSHHLLLFPTLGENFGHIISESLSHGCPALISDRTPWRGLEEHGVGWDVPLERPDEFRRVLQQCVDMTEQEYRPWSRRAAAFALQRNANADLQRMNLALFEHAMRRASTRGGG